MLFIDSGSVSLFAHVEDCGSVVLDEIYIKYFSPGNTPPLDVQNIRRAEQKSVLLLKFFFFSITFFRIALVIHIAFPY